MDNSFSAAAHCSRYRSAFSFTHRGLTQQVDRVPASFFPQALEDRKSIGDRCTGYEGFRRLLDLMSNRLAAQRGTQAGRGECFQSPLQAKNLLALSPRLHVPYG